MSQKTVHFTNNSAQTLDNCAHNYSPLRLLFASFQCIFGLIRCRQSDLWVKTCSRAKKAPAAGSHYGKVKASLPTHGWNTNARKIGNVPRKLWPMMRRYWTSFPTRRTMFIRLENGYYPKLFVAHVEIVWNLIHN